LISEYAADAGDSFGSFAFSGSSGELLSAALDCILVDQFKLES